MNRRSIGVLLTGSLLGCAGPGQSGGGAVEGWMNGPLAAIESAYQDTRYFADQLDVTRASGRDTNAHGVSISELQTGYTDARARLVAGLSLVDSTVLQDDDLRAYRLIQETTFRSLGAEPARAVDAGEAGDDRETVQCDYDAATILEAKGEAALVARIFACYGIAALDVRLDDEHLDRLTVFGLMATTDDSVRRRRLFRALEPVWRSVNGDDGPDSPWRLVQRRRADRWGAPGGEYPHRRRATRLGIAGDSVESWLVAALEAWRDVQPEALIEPWDWYYRNGEADRRLSSRIPRDSLLAINHAFYRLLGADPVRLGIQYDVEPRAGKYPIAYTTFGARPQKRTSGWWTGEPWVFAAYRTGGLRNLSELLHETGHAVHIAAIRTRPAYTSWPDSDTFTEAIAELAGLDLYEPAWQQAFLGDSVPLDVSLRAKYGSAMLDLAWALFEIRMGVEPGASPNRVWSAITSEYLRIKPHPEWSWWAMRGQLIESPGYMLNYALGALLVAQVRDGVRAARPTDPVAGDPGWYDWVSERLYRFGLETPTPEVLADFLGGPMSPAALMADLSRASH